MDISDHTNFYKYTSWNHYASRRRQLTIENVQRKIQ